MKTKKSKKNTTRSRNSKRTKKQRGGGGQDEVENNNEIVTSMDPIVYIDKKYFKDDKDNFQHMGDYGRDYTPKEDMTTIINVGKTSKQYYRKEYAYDGNLHLFMLWYKKYCNSGAKNFYFTRHFNSCNNNNEGEFVGKDFEPLSPLESLGQTYKHALETDHFKSNQVFVSCLLRTWCTAVILYCTELPKYTKKTQEWLLGGTNANNLDFKLYVCPHLKEKKDENSVFFNMLENPYWERGNFPRSLVLTMMRFIKFLNTMIDLRADPNNRKNKDHLKHFYLKYWKPPQKITVYILDKDGGIIQTKDQKEAKYEITLQDGIYKLTSYSEILLTKKSFKYTILGSSNQTKIRKHYDKQNINAIQEITSVKIPTVSFPTVIHVVTHSNAMKAFYEYIKETQNFSLSEKNKGLIGSIINETKPYHNTYNIKSQNCGTIQVSEQNSISEEEKNGSLLFKLDSNTYKATYMRGYYNSKKGDEYKYYDGIKLDKKYQSLCGDETEPLKHKFMNTSSVITTDLGGTKKRRSKQKRRTRRKKH
tara:strand:- start:739 stop:2337 length:1599 start_codon:yes stop_codon:yes gene_type:complete